MIDWNFVFLSLTTWKRQTHQFNLRRCNLSPVWKFGPSKRILQLWHVAALFGNCNKTTIKVTFNCCKTNSKFYITWNKMVREWVSQLSIVSQNLMRQSMQFEKSVNSYVPCWRLSKTEAGELWMIYHKHKFKSPSGQVKHQCSLTLVNVHVRNDMDWMYRKKKTSWS